MIASNNETSLIMTMLLKKMTVGVNCVMNLRERKFFTTDEIFHYQDVKELLSEHNLPQHEMEYHIFLIH